MRRTPLIAVAAIMAITTAGAPIALGADSPGRWQGWKPYESKYLSTYTDCWKALRADCGRNIVDDGIITKAGIVDPPKERVNESRARMDAWLNPPAPPPAPVSQPTGTDLGVVSQSVSTDVPSSSGGCVGMEAESGSAGYSAYNPSGGYIGCYQISPEHFASGGSCAGMGTDPAGQDACAAKICATEGPDAWSNPAGENPCGRL